MSSIVDLELARQVAAANREAAANQSKSFADDLTTLRSLDAEIEAEANQPILAEADEAAQGSFRFIGTTLTPSDYQYAGRRVSWADPFMKGEIIEDCDLPADCPDLDATPLRCNICNHALSHTIIVQHKTTGEYHTIGRDCAATLLNLAYDEKGKNEVAIRKHQAAKKAAARQTVLDANPGLAEAIALDQRIIKDIAARWERFGTITDKQIAYVLKLAAEINAKAEAFVASGSKGAPEGRGTHTLEVVSIKKIVEEKPLYRSRGTYQDHTGWEIRFRHADGWEARYVGAAKMFYEYEEECKVQVGDVINLNAIFTPSKTDPAFAFISFKAAPKKK